VRYVRVKTYDNLVLPLVALLGIAMMLMGCAVGKSSVSPYKKYSLQQVRKDYTIYQQLLEEQHPSLYWYTPKEKMDEYFAEGWTRLKDSMTSQEFQKVLTYVTAQIDCGHTSIRASKSTMRYIDTTRLFRIFPLSMKLWEDTMVVALNLNRRDSVLKRGTIIKSINGIRSDKLVDTLFDYISTDGYNRTHKFQTLSNRGFFGSLYSTVFGQFNQYQVGYLDSIGNERVITVPAYNPRSDTFARNALRPGTTLPKPSRSDIRKLRYSNIRLLQIDSTNHTAMMNLSSFGRGFGLRKFFRRSFRQLNKNDIGHLIIDVRSNGGGSVSNSTGITRYLTDHKFKIADSLYAVRRHTMYSRYVENNFLNRLFMVLFTRKHKDNNYHFGYFERHYFKPRHVNHFDGQTYILTGGNSFSATTLFASSLISQKNVTVVGEETGGGAYGNSAWLIPDATLPETGVRFRLPLFRLVINKDMPKNGRGVQPEVPSLPSIEAVKRNADYKLEKALELIRLDKQKKSQ
jgi:hypothetical protein